MADRIQFRRDTAANWAKYNPVLLEGEVGYITDNVNQYKIGDGVHAWNDLPLRGFDGNIVQKTGTDENAVMSQKAVTENLSTLQNQTSGVGYVSCNVAASIAAKTITITGLTTLTTGIRLLVKMVNNNTANDATLNINSLGAKPLYYNNNRVSGSNTWEAGEVVEVYYDGTNFYSSNILGGAGGGGNMILEWNTDVATTRKQVKTSNRKAGMQISYLHPNNGWTNEQYIGTAVTDTEWVKDNNWSPIETRDGVVELAKESIFTDMESNEIFEIGYPDAYWIEDGLLNATDFSIYDDGYSGNIDDLSGNNMPLNIGGLSAVDYSKSIAGIRGKELIKNVYNGMGNKMSVTFTTPINLEDNSRITFEVYANIHNDYVWNDKKIQNVGDKEIGNNSIVLLGGTSFYFALNSESVYYRGSLNTNVTTKAIEKIQIDGVDDATLRNVYYHIVFVINGNNKKMYIDGKEILNVDASRNDVVSNITWNLFSNWSANIKCVRIYNKALSVEEIQTNYEATVKKYES